MALNGTKENHESFGKVGLSRVTGGKDNLFGSSVRHSNFIRLRIHTAEKERDLHTNWYFAKKCLMEIDLSPTQFADMITAMNVGDGVPCTIRYVNVPDELNKGQLEPCPSYDQRKQFEDEFRQDVKDIAGNALKLCKEAETLLAQKTIKAADRDLLLGLLRKIEQDIRSNLPYVSRQFNEAMDKTVSEAKGEVEAFVQNKIVSLGIEALRKQMEEQMPTLPDRQPTLMIEGEKVDNEADDIR